MDRCQKLELVQRSLGIRHKLKVHESVKAPDNHEDLAMMLLAKWELEDELQAIEEILADDRKETIRDKKHLILRQGVNFARQVREKVTTQ